MVKSIRIQTFQNLLSWPIVLSLAFHSPFSFSGSSGADVEPPSEGGSVGQQVGGTLPNVKTPAGNAVYLVGQDPQGRARVMAVEYGQVVEGSLEKSGRIIWDSQLPTEIKTTAQDRPSRLGEKLEWNADSTQALEKEIEKLQSGRNVFQRAGGKAVAGATYIGGGAAYFYFALGMVAATNVLLFHSENPMALANYVKTLTDPVGYLSLAGFMIAAYPFFRSANLPQNRAPIRFFPRFAAGLVVGGLVSSLITAMGRDPSVRKCLNLDKVSSIAGGAKPERDVNACDKAFAEWTQPSVVAEQMAPSIATALAAGTIYYGVSTTLKFALTRLQIPARLQAIGVPKPTSIRGGNLVTTLVINAGHLLLFMGAYEFAKHSLGIEQWTREQFLTNFSLRNDELGATMKENFNQLQTTLFQLESEQFKDSYQNVKLMALEANLAGKMFVWRSLQLSEVRSAADQWSAKLAKFQTYFNKSYELYDDILKRIVFERTNPNAPSNDSSRLNWDYLIGDVLKKPENGYAGEFKDPEDWDYVGARNLMEYIVSSMACGPELEYESRDRIGAWYSPMSYIRPEAKKKASVLKDTTGFAVEFRPPQITNPSLQGKVCNQSFLGHSMRVPPKAFPVIAKATGPDGKTTDVLAKDLLEYVRKEIRPSVITANNEMVLENWWKENVLNQVKPAYQRFKVEYAAILNGPLRRSFESTDYKCLSGMNAAVLNKPGLMSGAFSRPDKCAKPTERSLARGIADSLRDEAKFYLNILRAIPISEVTKEGAEAYFDAVNAIEKQVNTNLDSLRKMEGQSIDLNKLKNEFLELEKKAKDALPAPAKVSPKDPKAPTKEEIAAIAKANEDFYGSHPYVVLAGANLRLLGSINEQIRLYFGYSRFPDQSGPAFLGN
jgi:hypothetical protein